MAIGRNDMTPEEAKRHIDFIQDSGLGRNIAAEDEPEPSSSLDSVAVRDAKRDDGKLEKSVEDSFPASDPPAVTQPANPPRGGARGAAPPDIVDEPRPAAGAVDACLDEEIEDSFPASDPPSLTQPGGELVGNPPRPAAEKGRGS